MRVRPLEAGAEEACRLALVVVDMQNDFMPGGALPVPGADAILPFVNHYVARFASAGSPVVLTRDWHPVDHGSFATRGGRWPVHCVAGSPGAEFPRALQVPAGAIVVSKGTARERDGYSAFEDTALAALLRGRGVAQLWVAGVATEHCVRATALDALAAGFGVTLLVDAIRAVDARPGAGDTVLDELVARGARAHAWPRRSRRSRSSTARAILPAPQSPKEQHR